MEQVAIKNINVTAIGGGGFTHDTYPLLDDFCLARAGKANPHIGFIAAASMDDPVRVGKFHSYFEGRVASQTHLPMTLDAQDLANHLEKLDIVYVGGGNTEAMVAHWCNTGWDKVLCAAAQRIALAGVSAGGVCWFERFLFDAGNGQMRPVAGLGLIKGGACPHYSTEPTRRTALWAAVGNRTMPQSIAIDDGVAVVFDSSGPQMFCAAEPDGATYSVERLSNGTVREKRLNL